MFTFIIYMYIMIDKINKKQLFMFLLLLCILYFLYICIKNISHTDDSLERLHNKLKIKYGDF